MRVVLRGILIFCGLLIATALLGLAYLAWQVDRLGGRDEARPADVIVVMGARVNADGTPGSDLISRTYHAVDLWQAGLAQHIICAGGYENEPLSAAAVCKRFAVRLGAPAGQVWLADGTSDSLGDARAAAAVMAAHGWRSAILVSHPLHVYRARWLFRRVGIEAVTSPTTTDTAAIFLPARIYYAVREAGGVALSTLDSLGALPPSVRSRLRALTYAAP